MSPTYAPGYRTPGCSYRSMRPSLPAVLAGHVPTESGYGTLRSIDASLARSALADVVTAAGAPVVLHCCAAGAPLGLFREAGAVAVAIDLDHLDVARAGALDPLG